MVRKVLTLSAGTVRGSLRSLVRGNSGKEKTPWDELVPDGPGCRDDEAEGVDILHVGAGFFLGTALALKPT